MKTINLLIIFTLALFSLLSCENEPESNLSDDKTIKAIGSFKNSVDKEKWGDFNFVLELDKPVYSIGESINIQTYFINIGNKTIILDGILPYRQSAGPPTVEVLLNDSVKFSTSKFLESLNNENDIIIEPNKKVVLSKFNLLNVEGELMILDKENNLYRGSDTCTIESLLTKGSYKIYAFFNPTPQVYWSITDTLEFTIK